MPDFPIPAEQSPFHLLIPEAKYRDLNVSAAAGAVWTANDAALVPFELNQIVQVNQIGFIVDTQSGNISVGIYTQAGTRIVASGSTVMGVAGYQVVNITDQILGRGRYYAAFQIDNNLGKIVEVTALGGANINALQMVGVKRAAPAFPLPATVTPATPTRTTMPYMVLELA